VVLDFVSDKEPLANIASDEPSYRYGFNGKENDNEVKGQGNQVDFGDRIYDSRLGRWLSIDKHAFKYPAFSPYSSFDNNPIYKIDIKGNDGIGVVVQNANKTGGTVFVTATYYIVKSNIENNGFSESQIADIKNIEQTLNKENRTISKDIMFESQNLKGYNVQFVFNIVEVNSISEAEGKLNSNSTTMAAPFQDGNRMFQVNNIIKNVDENVFNNDKNFKDVATKHGSKVKNMLGATEGKNREFIAIKKKENYGEAKGFMKTVLHEIFHTLFFNKDGNINGVGQGQTLYPSQADIDDVIQNIPKTEANGTPYSIKN
jgi:RHS repeat-associated protein